jgi:hypothetical protein
MPRALQLGKNSLGMGDRFGCQAEAQLRACVLAEARGLPIVPVWNKSNREHSIIGSAPAEVRASAEIAVARLGWKRPWHVDADHIRAETVDRFIQHCDFFTIDVADAIGKPCGAGVLEQFLNRHAELGAGLEIPGIKRRIGPDTPVIQQVARQYLLAVGEAGRLYRHIEKQKGPGSFIVEISMDETEKPQTPFELLLILAALADEGVPVQNIAPKFSGEFHKGVDYAGDLVAFDREFNDDLCVLQFASQRYGLPANLKLSVHSGSDKFAIYPSMRRALEKHQAGVHLKTAGTSWLEELLGLAEAGGQGLAFARQVYSAALKRIDELAAPYATVIQIERECLPTEQVVAGWSAEQFVGALRHEPGCKEFNPHLRQLLHIAFKIAAENRARYVDLLGEHHSIIARNVTSNLFERHIRPLFIGWE